MEGKEYRALLEDLSKKTGAYCQLFLEEKTEYVILYGASIEDLQVNRTMGGGLRLINGEANVYTYTSDTSDDGIRTLMEKAAEMFPKSCDAAVNGSGASLNVKPVKDPCPVKVDPKEAGIQARIQILKESAEAIRSAGIQGTFRFQFSDVDQLVRMVSNEKDLVEDRRINSCVRLTYTLDIQGKKISSWTQYVRPAGVECFETEEYRSHFVRFLKGLLEQKDPIVLEHGSMPVVFSPSAGGTFWHECCGHQLEARAICHHVSDFVGKIGEKVASEKVTLIDDGTYPFAYGSSVYDDEGNPRQKNILIEKGILKQYLCDEYYGRLLGFGSNGSGRRQNFTFEASSRMSNTYLAPGEDDPEEIIKEIPYGLYVKNLGGGSGGKVFSILCTEGYLIRDGKIAEPVKNCMLTARGMEVMQRVDRVGNDVKQEGSGGGFCGADSGLIPVTSFGPTFRLSEMEVG